MRASQPIRDGYVERDGVKIFYEVFGSGEPTVLLLPTWSIIHSRHWKMQIPYLARHCRVITFDGRGNGRSDRPTDAEAYAETEFAADAIAVLDATETPRAIIVGFSMGAQRALFLAANHPDRVEAAAFIGPSYPGRRAARTGTYGLLSGRTSSTPTRAGRSTTAGTGSATIAASSSSSSPRCSPSRIRPSRSKTASTGASRQQPRRSR